MSTATGELVKTEICKLTEVVAESALAGSVAQLVVVTISPSGQLQATWVGCDTVGAVGALQLALAVTVRKGMT